MGQASRQTGEAVKKASSIVGYKTTRLAEAPGKSGVLCLYTHTQRQTYTHIYAKK